MRRAGAVSICAGLLLLGFGASPGTAAAGLHKCPGFTAHSVRVTKVRSNFACGKTRAVLRHLLEKGVSRLPPKTKRARRWGCGRSRGSRVCTWRRSGGRTPRRVRFRASKIEVDPVEACIEIWNRDGLNRAQYGSHFYLDHHIRDAWVYAIPNPAYADVLRCVVVFSVPASDPYLQEYGSDGEVRTPSGGGWQLINKVPELGDPKALQDQAPQHVNASLYADGSLERTR